MKANKPHLTDKEEETMFLLWEHGPCTVKELLPFYDDPKPHINTASTYVRALEAKGFVDHTEGRYGSFSYFPIKSKDEYQRKTLRSVISRCFGSGFSMVSRLVEDEQLDADELRELLDMVENKKK